MNSEESLKMIPLAPEDLRSLSEQYCVQSSLIARLVRLLQVIRSLDGENLSVEESELLCRLGVKLEGQVLAVLYPALATDGLMLFPDERSQQLRVF